MNRGEQPYLRDAPYLPVDLRRIIQTETIKWFQRHKDMLNAFSTSDATVMSMLRPETWTDRDYGLDTERLELLLARLLGLTRSQRVDLHKWKTKHWTGDIGAQVARILENMKRTIASAITEKVTVEEIEIILLSIASHNEGSSDLVKGLASACDEVEPFPLHGLKKIYDRLQPREAKWLTRLLLKTTGLVAVPADFGISSYQSQLPNCVKVHVEIPASVPPALQIGLTGAVKASLTQKQSVASEETATVIPRPAQKTISRRSSTPRDRSWETDLDYSRRSRRRLRESPLIPWDGPLPPVQPPKSVTDAATPAAVEPAVRLPPAKRRRISREGSPGAFIFARGILKPLLPTELPYNSSPERDRSHNRTKGHAFNNMLSRKRNPEKCRSLQLGGSSHTSQTRSQSNININLPTPPKSSSVKKAVDSYPLRCQKRTTINRPEAQQPNEAKSGLLRTKSSVSKPSLALQTPPSSDPTLHSAARAPISRQVSALGNVLRSTDLSKMQDQNPDSAFRTPARAPISRQVSMLATDLDLLAILTTKESSNTASDVSARAPISRQVSMLAKGFNTAALSITEKRKTTSEASTIVVTKPGDVSTPLTRNDFSVIPTSRSGQSTSTRSGTAHVIPPRPLLPLRTLPDPNSPLLKAGTGTCTLATTTCPLISAIFLIPPTLPPAVTTRLVMTLLPHHGAFYLLSTHHLAHPSLPRRCPVTHLKYRKIVLVEPAETQEMLSIVRDVEDLELKRSKGRKFWVECFDWRLLEGVGRRECGIKGSGANVWSRNWICCV